MLDLLSAIRCRLRRQLFRSKDLDSRSAPFGPDLADAESTSGSIRRETELEELARVLIDLHQEGMRPDEVQVLYAHHVLGYSMAELGVLTGRDAAPSTPGVTAVSAVCASDRRVREA